MTKSENILKCKIIILFLILIIAGCSKPVSNLVETPMAINGILDFSTINIDESGTLNLDGEWEFYWNKLLEPDDFIYGQPVKTGLIQIPGLWNDFIIDENKLPSSGYATFRLILKNMDEDEIKAIRISDINTAYTLWIEDKFAARNGTVGTTREEMIPQYLPQLITFKPEKNSIQLIIQVSNFYHNKGGIWKSIEFGNFNSLLKIVQNKSFFEIFLIGALLVMVSIILDFLFLAKERTHYYILVYFV